MNHVYRVIFNPQLGLWQAVCECARGRGKSRSVTTVLSVATLLGAAVLPGAWAQSITTTGSLNLAPPAQGQATWDLNSQKLIIGPYGTSAGTLSVSGGAKVINAYNVDIGNTRNLSTVTVTGSGSQWNGSGLVNVGALGVGSLTIENGGALNGANGAAVSIATGIDSVGTVTVTGQGSRLYILQKPGAYDTSLYVGARGQGSLKILDGGVVSSYGAFVGGDLGGKGTVLVSGAGSQWNMNGSALTIGFNASSTGTLTVEKYGLVTAGWVEFPFLGSDTSLHLNGDVSNGRGVLQTNYLSNGSAAKLDLNGGILRAAGDQADFLQGFGSVQLGANGVVFDTNGANIGVSTAFSSASGQSSGLTKQGLGTLTLTGASSYTGGTTLSAGTLQLGNGGNMGALNSTSGIAIASGATLAFNRGDNGLSITAPITGAGRVAQQGSGRVTLSGNNSYAGGTALNAGTLTVGNSGALGTGALTVGGASTLDNSSFVNLANSVQLNANLTLTGNNAMTLGGLISGNGGLVKNGAASLTRSSSSAPSTRRGSPTKSPRSRLSSPPTRRPWKAWRPARRSRSAGAVRRWSCPRSIPPGSWKPPIWRRCASTPCSPSPRKRSSWAAA